MSKLNQLASLVAVFSLSLACAPRNSIGAEAQSQPATTNAPAEFAPEEVQPKSTIWQAGIGEGFLPTAQTFGLELGVAPGIAAFGSQQAHDFALMSLSYGHMLGRVKGEGHWYRGNFEGRLELWGGGQYSPSSEWIIGLTPHLRYNFATGSRWVPFFDLGAGVTATGIGPPDLSGTFEFNLQATVGVHYFLRENLALTSDVRFLHISCAGIHQPNLGANNVAFMVGLTWFFGS
jgi:hypothetical protein